MTLKSITLHRAASDNAGNFQDAGTDLVVGEAAKDKTIDAARVRALIDSHGATGHHAAATKSASTAKRSAPKKPKAPTKVAVSVPAAEAAPEATAPAE